MWTWTEEGWVAWQDYLHALSGESTQGIPVEDRCWKCDGKRVHEGCIAGLCTDCCEELKAAS